jgi:cytochrome c oxidase assembly protein subunit 15
VAARLDLVVTDVARIHSIAVWILLAMLLVALRWIWTDHAPAQVRTAAQALLVVLVLQGAVGYTQYFTGVPALLVGIHIVGALGVWIATIHLNMVTRA